MLTAMLTWRRGRTIMFDRLRRQSVPLEQFLESVFRDPPARVPGTAVFLTATPDSVPSAMLHNLNHNKVLHERVVFVTAEVLEVPWVPFDQRVSVASLGHDCWRVTVRFGFKNPTDVPQALELARDQGLELDPMQTSYFLSRETVVPVADVPGGMALWRERLFATMARNAGNAADYFHLPANRVIELGTKVEI
jgi:KUP system potassium uptake protein